jgi:sec-independent protein translocase protein TatA
MLVALVVLLVLGPRKLPELARGIGESMKELKHSLHGASESEEAQLLQDVSRTVQETVHDLKDAANPLTPPVRPVGS